MTDAPECDLAGVDAILAETGRSPDALIPILRAIQDQYNYLPPEALRHVADHSDITPAAIAGVSTFYAQFRHRPAGRHCVRVCVGTACHVKGADSVTDAIKRHLDIAEDDDTDPEGQFTVEEVACLGCCMLAPVARIDDMTYGDLEPQKAPQVLHDFLKSQQHRPDSGAKSRPKLATQGELRCCLCSSCKAAGADHIHAELQRLIDELHLPAALKTVGCTGVSFEAPLIEVVAGSQTFRYGAVQPANLRGILLSHFRPASAIRRIGATMSGWVERLLTDEAWEPMTRFGARPRDAVNYTKAQVHIATEHAGELAPLDIDEYLAHDGFAALRRCLESLSPDEIIEQVTQAGLRGRGGAGFPTGVKWASVRATSEPVKYLICNGDEGDPGAFMDRLLLESFPFRVIEGMIIAAYAVGIDEGIFYIRAEYPLATERIRRAIAICEERNFLGDNILGAGHKLHLRVVEGAGAFVCGEETALIAAIEGQRGSPRYRPPFPAHSGLYRKPTLINNVETLANISWIIRNGAEAFAKVGTDSSKGTKTFALAGKIRRGGLIEIPMGMTLRQIVEDVGGGVPDGKALKAVQVGGPSGGCVPASLLDTPVDYQALTATGAIMGSGGLVVLDEDDCMVDVARYFLAFTQEESCGKCTHCRVGTKRMLEILTRLCEGRARADDLDHLRHLVEIVPQGSLCGLGKTAPNPVATTLRYFADEYEAHMRGDCPAKTCKPLIAYKVIDGCIGCTICAQNCPTDSIPLTPYQIHHIDLATCIRCDICRVVCPHDAITVEALCK
jgi:NADH-quinone oxidoreductase subunit F